MKEIREHLLKFDRERGWNTYEALNTKEEKINELKNQVVNCLGELGELANEVKKCGRDNTWNESNLKEEVADIFIFLMKIANTLDMDLKEEVLKKIKINEKRFAHFKKNGPSK